MNPTNDEILEALRPRMRQARIAHVRRVLAGVAVVPLLGLGAVAMAADQTDDIPTQTASGGLEDDVDAPVVDLPDIGDAGGDEADPAEIPDPDGDPDATTDADTATDATVADDPAPKTTVLNLGLLGRAEVSESEDGGFELLSTDITDGWEVVSVDNVDGVIKIIVTNGEAIKLVTITHGVRDELEVDVIEVVIPTTTTTTTTVKPPPPPAPVVERIVVEVPGKGSFVVEREGETLRLGNVQANAGYDYEIQKAEGWKVYVLFTDGQWDWYGKALINDNGEIEQHFWDEERAPDPVFQWVEVPGVGAVKFKLYSDGLIYVKEWVSDCCSFYDYNGGAAGETAKVDFEGSGILWIIEVWKNAEGGMSWSTTDMSPAAEPA